MQQHNTRGHKINIYSHELLIKICRGDETKKKRKEGSSHGSRNSGADVGILLFIKLAQTKVKYLRIKVTIK